MALIDLGDTSARVPDRRRPRTPRTFRTVLLGVSILLLAGLAGAAANPAPARPTVVPARLGDTMFVEADRFFLVRSDLATQDKIVSAYALPGGTLLSRTRVAVPGAIFSITSAGTTILVSFQVDTVGAEATVALTPGNPVPRWRRPARLLGVSAADGLVLLRENSPQFGGLHWYGIDLATGAQAWELEQPVRGFITETDLRDGFPHRLVVATSSGDLAVRDTLTGRIIASGTFTAPSDWERRGIAMWPDGDLILIGDHTTTMAYGRADLKLRWTAPVDLYSSYIGPDCGPLVCFFSPRSAGMIVVDRATGRRRWTSRTWSYAERVGPYLLAGDDVESGGSHALTVVDPVTGRVHGDFGRWQSLGEPAADGTVIGLRQAGDTVFYARLDPARLTVRVLGVADRISGDCRTTDDVLICRRLDSSVAIFALSGG